MRTLPSTVTQVLGDEAATDLAHWFDDALREHAVPRDEFGQVLSRLDMIEHDLGEVKVHLDRIDGRFETMEARLDVRFESMEARFDARLEAVQRDMNARFDAMQRNMNARFDAMQRDRNARFDAVHVRFDTVNERIDTIHDVVRSQTRWLMGTLIALGGLISALLTIFEFLSR